MGKFKKKTKTEGPHIYRRNAQVRLRSDGTPETVNEEKRSVEVVAATENKALVWNPETWRVEPEILLMSGMRQPDSGKITSLDTHDRTTVRAILGSARELNVENDELIATAFFAADKVSQEAFEKVRDGHLTDVSIGYTVHTHLRVKDGETTELAGRTYEGPVLIATDWTPRELSWCAIGADQHAKARNEPGTMEEFMTIEELNALRKRFNMPDADETAIVAEMTKRSMAEEGPSGEQPGNQPQPGQDGQRFDPPLTPAPAVNPVTPPAPAADGADFSRSDAVEIVFVCSQFGMSERAAEFIEQGASVTDVYRQCSAALLGQGQQQEFPGQRIEGGPTEQEKFRQAGENAIMARCGHAVDHNEMGGFGGYSMVELCRHAVALAGGNSSGYPTDIVGRALSTSDLPMILDSVADRLLLAGFEEEESTHEIWCDTSGVLTDYRPKRLIRPGEISSLKEIPEGGEYSYGTLGEEGETVMLAKFGLLFRLTREALINDDLDALSSIGNEMGASAKRTIADLPYAVLFANEQMGDGLPLFDASRKNLVSPGSAIGTESLDLGFKNMRGQKDIGGKRRLNIRPHFLLAPTSLEGAAEQFFNTTLIGGKTNQPNLANRYAGDNKLVRVYDGRMDDHSEKAWFLAGPKGKTVKMYFLNGNKTPFTESKNGWNIDGIEKKVRIEAVAKAISAKALSQNVGQ